MVLLVLKSSLDHFLVFFTTALFIHIYIYYFLKHAVFRLFFTQSFSIEALIIN